jgi:hypothetical protein
MKRWYRGNGAMETKMGDLLKDLYRAFGWKTRMLAPLIGLYALACLRREDRKLKEGWACEPATLLGKNAAAIAAEKEGRRALRVAIPEIPLPIVSPSSVPGR